MPNWRVQAAEHKLLPAVVDEIAQKEPNSLWAEYPLSSTTFEDGFGQITYAQFANAVNGIAHFITHALGKGDTGEALAWLAPNDPRCSIALVAAIKAGFKLFLVSERNSVAANHKLFDDINCSTIVTTSLLFPPVKATRSGKELVVLELPSLQNLLNKPQPGYLFQKDLSTSHREVAFMVHTSGSTGFPKPISITHEFLAKAVRDIGISAPDGYVTQASMIEDKRCVLLLPLGHPAGVNFGIILAFFTNTTVILPLPHVPPTGEALVDILAHIRADWAALAPLTLETISKNMSLLDTIGSKLDMLVFSGGSLPKVFGDVIAAKVKLLSFLGSSETGPLQSIYRNGYDFRSDWNYLQFPPELGARFDPRPGGVYELVFKRTPETEPYQAVFASYPDLTEFRTRDLFTKHSTIPDLWTHASRSDDVIVFINGEKVNPVDYESHVSTHPDVAASLMFGQQRFEAGLLIELNGQTPRSAAGRAHIIQRLWPTIEAANQILPAYAQVSETHICFTDPGKPVLRTLKNTIRRQATLDLYKDKINQVYADVEEMWTASSDVYELVSAGAAQRLVGETLQETTKLGEIDVTDDFFKRGLDSLQVLRLVRHLRLKTALGSINPSLVYLNPTISALASSLYQIAHDDQISEKQKRENQLNTRAQMLQEYLNEIDSLVGSDENTTSSLPQGDGDKVVLLTGSTGAIGSYILNALVNRPDVTHIYCLNRSLDSGDLQSERNSQHDHTLPLTFPDSKVTFLTTDLSDSSTLGLPENIYDTLKSQATHIIHNAWIVDFNLPLQTFKPQLAGTVNLAAFCARSTHQAALIFISSISAVMNFRLLGHGKSVPESIVPELQVSADAGYAESKYLAERLIEHATKKLGLKSATILRLGQIAGSATTPGRWNPVDWIPALVRGSRELGVIPDSLDSESHTIDWLPIDRAAEVIVEVGLDTQPESEPASDVKVLRVLHPLNPHRTSWKSLLPSIITALEEYEPSKSFEVVSPSTWVTRLRAAATKSLEDGQEALLHANPALRLIDFFQARLGGAGAQDNSERLIWETSNAERVSAELRAAEAIDGEMMGRWTRQWLAEGQK